jgi:hypothetical protein
MAIRSSFPLAALLAVALAAGCASAPSTAGRDCSRLDQDISLTQRDRSDAQRQGEQAWEIPIPLIGAGRYAFSKASLAQADKRLGDLHAESVKLGCTPTATAATGSATRPQ